MKEVNKYKDLKYINLSINIENWKIFASQCPYRMPDQQGNFVCTFYEDTVGECNARCCPLLREDVRAELKSEGDFLKCVIHMEVVA